MPKRLALSFLVGMVALATLTGCVPQSRDSLDRYVEALDAVPGVDIDYYGVSTPLPFSVQGSVELSLDADAETLAELQEVGCETEVNASVYLGMTVHAGASSVLIDNFSFCGDLLVDVIGLATAIEPFAVDLSVDDIVGTRIGVSEAESLAETLAVFRVAADFALSGPSQLTGERLRLETDELAVGIAHLDDFAALVAEFEIAEIDLEGANLVIQVAMPSEADGVRDFLLARDPRRYGDLDILVTDAASGDVPSGTDLVVIELRDRIVADLGMPATIGGNSVSVRVDDSDALVTVSRQIAELNPDAVRVQLTIREDEAAGIPGFRVRPLPELTPSANPYPDWAQMYDRLAATGLVQTVEPGPGSLSVWVTDADYDDPDAVATVRAVVDDLAEEYGLTRWELNNRDLTEG